MTDQAGAPTAQPAAREGLAFRKRRPITPASTEDKNRVGLLEGGFLIFSVALFLGISTIASLQNSPDDKSNPVNTVLYLGVLMGTALLLWLRRRELVPVLTSSKLIWIFLAWATASIAWSIDPGLTIRRLILFYTPVLVALYAAARFDPATTIKLAGWAYFSTIMVSAAVAILLPNVGVMKDDWQALFYGLAENERLGGDWAGILGHKNVLGFATLANTQIFAWRWYVEKDKRWLFGPIVLIGMVVAYKTHSATSGLLIIMTIFGYFFLHLLRKASRLRALMLFTVFSIGTAVIAAALMLPDQFTAMIGKNATLTGRIPLWNYLITYAIPNHPLLGYGFNSYFIPANPDFQRLAAVVGWPAPHAHNGYLNLAVELGIPGAVLGTLILLRLLIGAARGVFDEKAPWILHVLVFTATVTLLNLTEASLLRLSDNWEFSLIFCCFALWKYQAENRPKTRPAPRRWGELPTKLSMKQTTELK